MLASLSTVFQRQICAAARSSTPAASVTKLLAPLVSSNTSNVFAPAPAAVPSSAPRSTAVRAFSEAVAAEHHESMPRVYTDFGVYKGKAAMKMKLIGATVAPYVPKNSNGQTSGGSGQPAQVVDREGVLLLELAAANQASGNKPGDRSYNWSDKITFALKAIELGQLVEGDYTPGSPGVNFFHDPNKGNSNSGGSIYKSLKVTGNPDGSYMFNVTVDDKTTNTKKNINVQVTKAEFWVIKKIADRCVPYMLGFEHQIQSSLW